MADTPRRSKTHFERVRNFASLRREAKARRLRSDWPCSPGRWAWPAPR